MARSQASPRSLDGEFARAEQLYRRIRDTVAAVDRASDAQIRCFVDVIALETTVTHPTAAQRRVDRFLVARCRRILRTRARARQLAWLARQGEGLRRAAARLLARAVPRRQRS